MEADCRLRSCTQVFSILSDIACSRFCWMSRLLGVSIYEPRLNSRNFCCILYHQFYTAYFPDFETTWKFWHWVSPDLYIQVDTIRLQLISTVSLLDDARSCHREPLRSGYSDLLRGNISAHDFGLRWYRNIVFDPICRPHNWLHSTPLYHIVLWTS